jgi:protease YdgD
MRVQIALFPMILAASLRTANCHELLPADVNDYPWASIGKLYNRAGEACTGAIISVSEVATAAHCLYNPRTRILLQSESLHFLIGYKQGEYREDLPVSKFIIGPDYQYGSSLRSATGDWAILTLALPVKEKIKPLTLSAKAPNVGDQIMVGGFAQSRQFVMTADKDCSLRAVLSNGLLVHDCAVMRGDSGAPLLRLNGGRAEVIGIHVGSVQIKGAAMQIAVPAANLVESQN